MGKSVTYLFEDDQCNLSYISDRMRLDYVKGGFNKPTELQQYTKEELAEDLLNQDDLVMVLNYGSYVKYYEKFVDSCWDALFQKPEYKNLEIGEAVTKLVNERLKKVAEYAGGDLVDWSWDEDLEILELIIQKKDMNEIKKLITRIISEELNVEETRNNKVILKENVSNLVYDGKTVFYDKVELIKKFIKFCKKHAKIKHPIKLVLKKERGSLLKTLACFDTVDNILFVYIKGRHIADVMRSAAHELKHLEQNLRGVLKNDSGKDGSPHENEANSFAGVMMRKFGKLHPEIYE